MASEIRTTARLRPVTRLIVSFLVWKFVLLGAAVCSPGRGYDTSTDLAFLLNDADSSGDKLSQSPVVLRFRDRLISRLVRWDAIYFVSLAKHGYQYEQEWAFGYGYSKLISLMGQLFLRSDPSALSLAFMAIAISNVAHLLSVLVLHRLTKSIYGSSCSSGKAFIVPFLHIIAPAGLFLSSPCGESFFSLLTFTGVLLYQSGMQVSPTTGRPFWPYDAKLLLAGLVFGAASMVRSNGILNGLFYIYDLLRILPNLPAYLRSFEGIRYGIALAIGGAMVGFGFAYPQYVAYTELCRESIETPHGRPWCHDRLPSVYTFVQDHYWNNGFLRYWTIPNIPLFALALPMLSLMLWSGFQAFADGALHTTIIRSKQKEHDKRNLVEPRMQRMALQRLAVPQLCLAILTILNHHVQIITRIGSGYALPYMSIADMLEAERHTEGIKHPYSRWIVRWMIMYAVIQGGLYACFLPPA